MIEDGIEEVIKGKELFKWIKDGTRFEDRFPRFFNHFHNPIYPIESWGSAGLDDFRLPQIANDMQEISMISIADKSATYRIRRVEVHNTGTHSITYYIYFILDEDGIWKIYRF